MTVWISREKINFANDMVVAKRKRRQRRRKQQGGVLPLAAAIPALVAVRKAVGLGAAGGAANYDGKKAMQALFKQTQKRKR